MPDVGVIYLYRFAEGEGPVRRFLDTYSKHAAGVDHNLHVVFKGFPNRDSLVRGRALFADVPINSIEHEDIGYDIGSYLWAARHASNRRLMFLNTFSQLLADDWLSLLDRALSLPGIGLVGATGSWLASTAGYEAQAKFFLGETLLRPARLLGRGTPERLGSQRIRARRRRRPLRRYFLAPLEYLQKLYEFGRYPNPHIRTNAFMMERERFLSLDFPKFVTKIDAYKFESGRRSMTKQVLRRKLSPVVVDKFGKVYAISEWKSSSTFWTDEQTNLIIADNRTSDYARADPSLRQELEDLAWVRPWDWYGNEA